MKLADRRMRTVNAVIVSKNTESAHAQEGVAAVSARNLVPIVIAVNASKLRESVIAYGGAGAVSAIRAFAHLKRPRKPPKRVAAAPQRKKKRVAAVDLQKNPMASLSSRPIR